MKAARRLAIGVGAVMLAAAGTVPTATAAAAHEQRTYQCEFVDTGDLPYAAGWDCGAYHGAPEDGPVYGPFRMEDYRGTTVQCSPDGGYADLPRKIEGDDCVRI